MTVPVLDFPALWRGMRCPRQLRRIIDQSVCHNPKLCTPEMLAEAVFAVPGLDDPIGPDRSDWLFSRHQEQDVLRLAADLFPQARAVEGSSLWEIEGESLRELGWLSATGGNQHRMVQLHKDNWRAVLARLPAVAGVGFLEKFLWAKADWLFLDSDGSWILVMVRSGARVKDSYIAEAGFIRDVFLRKQVRISQCFLLCPDESYRRPADGGGVPAAIDPGVFFQLHSLNHPIKHLRESVLDAVPRVLTAARDDEGCDSPRSCPVCSVDAAPLPEHHIHTLHRGGKAVEMLERQGIVDLADIDKADRLSRSELKDRHFIQLNSIRRGQAHVDRSGLGTFLKSIVFPVLFLDFETTAQALPPVAGVRPWEHVPFMFSWQRAAGESMVRTLKTEGGEFLAEPRSPRFDQLRLLAERLAVAGNGCRTLCVYGGALESTVLMRLAELYPDLSGSLLALRDGLVDLQSPFQQFHYYHPKQYGKLSLKRVLPLLTGASHQELAMQNGGEANLSFYFMSNPDAVPGYLGARFGQAAQQECLNDLRAYCGMDTLGLVHILSALYALAD